MKENYTNLEDLERDYQAERKRLHSQHAVCHHNWEKPVRDDRIEKVGYGVRYVAQGVDLFPEFE